MRKLFYKEGMSFLAFEGVDGSGKSSLIELFSKILKKKEIPFKQTKEPGGKAISEKIRSILLSRENEGLNPLAETLLYYADRKQHIQDLIAPALAKKIWVLSDRYSASTSAYHCGGRGISEGFVENLKKEICGDCQPNLWVLLDLPVEISLKRLAHSNKNHPDRMEREALNFHQRVREYYLKLAGREPDKWLILDATQSPTKLLEKLLAYLSAQSLLK